VKAHDSGRGRGGRIASVRRAFEARKNGETAPTRMLRIRTTRPRTDGDDEARKRAPAEASEREVGHGEISRHAFHVDEGCARSVQPPFLDAARAVVMADTDPGEQPRRRPAFLSAIGAAGRALRKIVPTVTDATGRKVPGTAGSRPLPWVADADRNSHADRAWWSPVRRRGLCAAARRQGRRQPWRARQSQEPPLWQRPVHGRGLGRRHPAGQGRRPPPSLSNPARRASVLTRVAAGWRAPAYRSPSRCMWARWTRPSTWKTSRRPALPTFSTSHPSPTASHRQAFIHASWAGVRTPRMPTRDPSAPA